MKPPLPKHIRAAINAEAVASDLASAADHLAQSGRTIVAQALLQHARHYRVQAMKLRAQAAAEHYATVAKPR